LRAAGAPIISTWIDEAGEGESADLHDLWGRCISESKNCDALIVYREPEDVLKGAWVEIGAALAVGRPVYAVGLNGFTISKYRGIKHFDCLADAFKAAGYPR
jgi:nucleoside 2-deoxyribosyltransferase